MNLSDCMKRHVVSVLSTATIREAAMIFVKKHIGLLPIVDQDDKLIGAVGLRDMLSLELPDFVKFIADVDFVHDFGAVETNHPGAKVLEGSIISLMKKEVITVEEDCGLLRAYALMMQYNLHDMPVVSKDGKLVGIASRVDIGTAILSAWSKDE